MWCRSRPPPLASASYAGIWLWSATIAIGNHESKARSDPGSHPHRRAGGRDDPPPGARSAQRAPPRDVRRDALQHDRQQRAADDRRRPRGQPDRLHLGRRRDDARDDRDHPDLGQVRRPLRQEAARADGPRDLLDRLADRRLRAVDGGADRRPRRPGPRRRRPDRAGPGRHRHDGLAARARPLQRLHRCGLRPRHGQRTARRRRARRHRRLALVLLRRPPGRGPRLRRAAEDAAPPGREARGVDRLPRRLPAGRRRLDPARLGLPRRPELRLDLVDQRPARRRLPSRSSRRPSTSRPTSPRTPSSRCTSSRTARSPSPPSPRC